MPDARKGILSSETTLPSGARSRIEQIGATDVVVGIPSHRNGRTIGQVVQAIVQGIERYLPGKRVALVNADGGSSDNTVRYVADAHTPPNVAKLLIAYRGPSGKGAAVRSILEVTALLNAKACAIFEARAPWISPEWVPGLIDPILRGFDVVLPCFERDAFSASLSENLVAPFLRTFLAVDVRDPVTSEFAVSGDLARELANRDVWETDIARFGINVWIAVEAAVHRRRVVQVELGPGGEGSGRLLSLTDARFLHPIGTLFRQLSWYRRLWQAGPEAQQIPTQMAQCEDRVYECRPDCIEQLYRIMIEGRRRSRRRWRETLSPPTLGQVLEVTASPLSTFDFADDLWARVALEFAVSFNEGEGDPDKVIQALLPLFYGRSAAYIKKTGRLSPRERRKVAQQIQQAFLDAKPYFVEQWQRNLPYGVGPKGSWFL